MTERHVGRQKEMEVKNHSGVCRLWKTQPKLPGPMEEFQKQRRVERSLSRNTLMASTLKERSHTWNKSCKDIAKREGDILKLAEMAANDEKQKDEEKHSINQLLRQLRKERQEEDHALHHG